MSYLTKPKLYNTGFLFNDENSRIMQGLWPQKISSSAYITPPSKNIVENPYFNSVKFPLKMPYVIYNNPGDSNSVPDGCNCLQNLRTH